MALFIKFLGEHPVSVKIEPGQVISIGRSPDTDLCVDDPLVSRRHCELEGAATGVVVRDLASRNGTRLNGERIEGEVIARPGDQVKVGHAHLLVLRQRGKIAKSPTAKMRGAGDRLRLGLPERLPGITMLDKLGESETGWVFRGLTPEDKDVAVRFLKTDASEEDATRFKRGARALARIDHPNIVSVRDVGSAGPHSYYVMELLRGKTLAEKTDDEPLGGRDAMKIGVQIARALKLCHNEGIIHRDVAPSHIMIADEGTAKLVGFDFVKDLSETGNDVTKLGDVVGDMTYISPEQARDPRSVDHRTDLYALGASLFHAVTGRPPFEGERLVVFRRVLAETPPRLRDLATSAPAALDEIISRLLEKDPDDRFQSGEELEAALNKALAEAHQPQTKRHNRMLVFDKNSAKKGGRSSGKSSTTTHTDLPAIDSSNSFGGGFSGLELLEILQFLEVQKKDGRLVVSSSRSRGEVFLSQGVIVHAAADDDHGEEAARRLLAAREGTFEFVGLEPGKALPLPPGTEPLELSPSALSVELMRLREATTPAR